MVKALSGFKALIRADSEDGPLLNKRRLLRDAFVRMRRIGKA